MKEIYVEENEYAFARSPDILTSGGLGVCIAIGALYGNKFKFGGMIHSPDFMVTPKLLDPFLRKLAKKHRDDYPLRLYLAGGNLVCDDEPSQTYTSSDIRVHVLERIAHFSLTDCIRKTWWNDRVDQGVDLTLNLQKGRATLTRYSMK